uniref:Uncharacterized protein n=1 Tax=Plectus sambesii TaxID=2011161 RepID=A0A914X0R0_9BILA
MHHAQGAHGPRRQPLRVALKEGVDSKRRGGERHGAIVRRAAEPALILSLCRKRERTRRKAGLPATNYSRRAALLVMRSVGRSSAPNRFGRRSAGLRLGALRLAGSLCAPSGRTRRGACGRRIVIRTSTKRSQYAPAAEL